MQHGDIWRGIDLLAEHYGLSPSGLAKLAGLDATAFNKSKRLPKDGRPRWPSTESIARILDAVGADFEAFAKLVSGGDALAIPLLQQSDLERVSTSSENDAVFPRGFETLALPTLVDGERCFAVEISNTDLAPVYSIGDRLIAYHGVDLDDGDRVIVKPRGRRTLIGTLCKVTADFIEIDTYDFRHSLDPAGLEWTARIVWTIR